jgi:hypothetical protein
MGKDAVREGDAMLPSPLEIVVEHISSNQASLRPSALATMMSFAESPSMSRANT